MDGNISKVGKSAARFLTSAVDFNFKVTKIMEKKSVQRLDICWQEEN